MTPRETILTALHARLSALLAGIAIKLKIFGGGP